MLIGEQLKFMRKSLGLTQRQVANDLFISYQSISNWERNKSHPTTDILLSIIDKYDLPINFFVTKKTTSEIQSKKNIIINYFFESMTYCVNKEPTVEMISQLSGISSLKIREYFPNYDDLIYTFINAIDQEILSIIEKEIKNNKNVIDIFINSMIPLLYNEKDKLQILYTRYYIKDIWLKFIKTRYTKIIIENSKISIKEKNNVTILVNIMTVLISEWISTTNPEPVKKFQKRLEYLTRTPLAEWKIE